MTRIQRYVLAIGIVFIAWLFHINMCEWHWKARVPISTVAGDRYPIWARMETIPNRGYFTTGLTTKLGIGVTVALIWGVFIPVVLVLGDIWWMLGWRRQHRLASGCCVSCGYDLKGSATQCPECGTARPD